MLNVMWGSLLAAAALFTQWFETECNDMYLNNKSIFVAFSLQTRCENGLKIKCYCHIVYISYVLIKKAVLT